MKNEDFEHIRRMTSRQQIIVFIVLAEFAKENKKGEFVINLQASMEDVVDMSHLSEGTVREALKFLLLDEHVSLIEGENYLIHTKT